VLRKAHGRAVKYGTNWNDVECSLRSEHKQWPGTSIPVTQRSGTGRRRGGLRGRLTAISDILSFNVIEGGRPGNLRPGNSLFIRLQILWESQNNPPDELQKLSFFFYFFGGIFGV
jgi:hypothetical protein